ncbi:MAG TPA: LiaF domain-containing protein, partial [Longimicrobium sp.]|nr:LiaF domain-containing protein [Longimicrobium sp.]
VRVERLGNARAERFSFEGGVGEATLDFSGAWTRGATASIQMGVGSLRLRLPRGIGVRIEKDSFLASFDAPGMVKRGGAWYSRNYEGAAIHLDISIDAALGSIDIDWVD